MKPRMTNLPNIAETQSKVKNLQEKIISQTQEVLGGQNTSENFAKSLNENYEQYLQREHNKLLTNKICRGQVATVSFFFFKF